jgi:hypothetical protein
MKKEIDIWFALGVVIGVVTLIVAGPLLTIWAVNTLFSTSIGYNVTTWLATFWLTMIIGGAKVSKKG